MGVMHVAEMLSRRHEFGRPASLRDRLRRWIGRRSESGVKETPVKLMSEAERALEAVEPTLRSSILRYMALLSHIRARGESRRLLEAARASARAIDEPHRQATELAELAGDLARLDDAPETIATGRALLSEAMALAEASSDPKATAHARAAVASVLTRNGRFDLALALAEQITDETERQGAWDRIAAVCAHAGEPEHVETLLARSSTRDKTTRQLAVALARAGRYEDALTAMADVRDEETVADIARALVERGHAERALTLLDSHADERYIGYHRVAVLAEIARASAEPAITRGALDRTRTIAEAIRSTTSKAMAYAELARAETGHGGESVASGLFEKAVTLANAKDDTIFLDILGPSARFSALKIIGERMTDAGFPDKALAIASSLEQENDDEWHALRASLIATVAARGARAEAVDVRRTNELFSAAVACATLASNSMIGPPWHVVALLLVGERLIEAGRWRPAFDAISQAHFTIDPFLIGIAEWADSLDAIAQGLSLSVIEAVARVFGWQRPDLTTLAEEISDSRR
jgi:tetratricopeptide (TPR) repeat protein